MSSAKSLLFENLADLIRALSHPARLEILECVAQSPRSVESLAEMVGMSVANTSQHLQQLRRAGLVAAERRGKHVHYHPVDCGIADALVALQQVAENNLAHVRDILARRFAALDSVAPVSRQELRDMMATGRVTLIDVRPRDEYDHGHVAGAVHVPSQELSDALSRLPRDREVIAYCRGRYCILSYEAVAMLREQGFTVRRLEDGFPEWRAAGLPVESAA